VTTANARDPAWAGGAVGDGVADDTVAIQAALATAKAAGGGDVLLPKGTYKISTLSFAGYSGVNLRGVNNSATTIVTTDLTGNVFDFTGAIGCGVSDLLIRPRTVGEGGAQRTGGTIFYLDNGTGSCLQNNFRRLRFASCYRAFQLNNCSITLLEDVQIEDLVTAWTWHSFINLTGAAISTTIRRLVGGTAALSNGVFYVPTGTTCDTIVADEWDLASQSGGSLTGVNINSGTWFRFNNLSIEGGTGSIAFITGGTVKSVQVVDSHLLGFRGFVCNGGTDITIDGGEVVQCQQEGIYAAALAAIKHLKINNVVISDCGLATTNTYDGIYITAGVNDFQIRGCTSDDASILAHVQRVRYGCNIDPANDRFTISDNHFYGATGGINCPATGAKQVVHHNTPDPVPSIVSATTLTLPGGPMVVVTGTTTVTSVTAAQAGRVVTLQFSGILTFTDGSNLKLAGNFVTTADDQLARTR
jgi:hypothetical protein